MSSETSTEHGRQPSGRLAAARAARACSPGSSSSSPALGCATAVTFLARGQGVTAVILLRVLMAATALVGMAALRTVRPLVSPDRRPHGDGRPAHARRARAREDAGAADDQGARVRSRDGEALRGGLAGDVGPAARARRPADAAARRRRGLPRADRARSREAARRHGGRTPRRRRAVVRGVRDRATTPTRGSARAAERQL